MYVGATLAQDKIGFYEPLLPGNDMMRVFQANVAVTDSGGTTKTVGVLPAWTDSRFEYCHRKGAIPFASTKVDGWAGGIAYVRNQLIQMPDWVTMLYITDRHEPEGDLGSGATGQNAYKTNFHAFYDMIKALPTDIRSRVKCGPVLTKTWTESNTAGKGGFDYSLYDPYTISAAAGGDFFGVDMYEPSGSATAAVSPSTLSTPVNFVTTFKNYKAAVGDTRPRLWPELGLIGMPADTDGSARATWLQGVHDEAEKMRAGQPGWTQPWSFEGWVWWNAVGAATGVVATIGQRRDFPLDDRTIDDTSTGVVKIVPPKPLTQFNTIWAIEHGTTPPAGGGGGGSTDPGPVTPPTSTPVWSYWVGATMKKADIPAYQAQLPLNGMFRIFPNADGLPPAWDDARFEYAHTSGAVPFASSNIDGDSTKFAGMKQWIIDMPDWLKQRPGVVLYLTDRHEPENNFKQVPSTYLTNYTNWYNSVIATLPADVRAKVAVGPVVTRQWIEGGATKGNGNYQQYDPGPTLSDFYGIDMYMDSWLPGNGTAVATAYVNPVTFLAGVKGYRYNNTTDTRPRIFAELGAIGIPTDPTGSARTAWINGLCTELDTWTVGAQGWKFQGFAWWNNTGTGGSSLTPIGTARQFYLDKYQNSAGVLTAYADPLPLKALNTQASRHYTLVTGGSDTGTPGQGIVAMIARSGLNASALGTSSTTIPPPVVVPPTSNIPANGPAAARALQAIYTVLVTDPLLNIIGDPLVKWQTLQATLRWKEPGSGQIVIPADPYVREQVQPGNRIVVLRRVLGTQHTLIAGPIEQLLWEKSDGADDNAGVGKLTITFVDDLAWLGARVTYPNPDKVPEAQTADYWVYTGNPEQAMLQLVATQAGPQALVARQVPKLQVAPYSGLAGGTTVQIVGTSDVSPREKFEKVTDVLRKVCTLGANSNIPSAPVYHPDSLGFRVRQTTVGGDPALLFEPLRSRDLSGAVHFSFGKGNLKYFSYELNAPTANTLIVGGSGEASDAFVREIQSPEPGELTWGRFEDYKSETGSDTLQQMQATAAETFADSLANARLASSAADTPDQRYGIHYDVGDIVSIELAPGDYEIAPVQTVNLQAFPTAGEVVGITIGDQSARYDSPFIARFRELDRRLGRVERRGGAA
jgi:hypothetical protein